jgi:hypothetical protein
MSQEKKELDLRYRKNSTIKRGQKVVGCLSSLVYSQLSHLRLLLVVHKHTNLGVLFSHNVEP